MRVVGWELSVTQLVFLFILIVSMVLISDITAFIGASLIAFIPAYMYLKSIRNTEQYDREPWEALRIAFAWGAISGVFLALLLSQLGISLLLILLTKLTDPSVHDILPLIAGAVIVAPIVEEFAKPLVMFRNQTIRKEINELEDGIVYGAACGLGFGATENVMYGLTEGLSMAGLAGMAFLIVIRTVSSILLHLVTTSYTGHGIARYMLNGEPFSVVLKYYLVAVIVHATWNLAAIYSLVFTSSETGAFLIFLFSIILAVSGLQLAKKKIASLDGAAAVPVNESLPPAESAWDGDSKWNRESKWGGEDKWNRESLWDSKRDRGQSSASQATTMYSTETTGTVGPDWDWKSILTTIFVLLYIAFNILQYP
ncbi:MAG TPA: PrsW family intramembrane metalloprotease [Candidatus Poseidoniia archaeon]|nr:PrsW family intramembrane metalloprotease [Candidatus Poseidoniia archaeon]|tara:strand:- start:246 stop:1352 length:1107 start_codon:yes stop_codon:yes gene_type:complete